MSECYRGGCEKFVALVNKLFNQKIIGEVDSGIYKKCEY